MLGFFMDYPRTYIFYVKINGIQIMYAVFWWLDSNEGLMMIL